MPKGMHLVRGMTSLNLKKPKVKITKKRMLELKEEHRLYNKKCKQTNISSIIFLKTPHLL